MSSTSKRRQTDFMKLMMNDYKVEIFNDDMRDIYVEFHGPSNSLYQGGVWRVRVGLPDAYPFESPVIRFSNKIYHPNVHEATGFVCLDVLNQTWSPMFDLLNVFEMFLPQLLLNPNPLDPLNEEAAALMISDQATYDERVKEYCEKYAKPEEVGASDPEEEQSDEKRSEDESETNEDQMGSNIADP